MKNITAAFPKRPLAIKGESTLQLMASMVLCAILILAGIGVAYYVANSSLPNIMRDWKISKEYEIIEDARIENGKCTVTNHLLRDCKLDIRYRDKNNSYIKYHHELTFFDIGSANYNVEVIRSTSDPQLVSIDLAIDKIWTRILALLFLIGMCLGFSYMIFFFSRRHLKWRKTREQMNGKIFKPILVNVTKLKSKYGVILATYTCNEAGKEKKSAHIFKKDERGPFYINDIEGDTKALGATVDGHSKVILLDATLQRFDMTDSERQALWQAREQDMTQI